MRVRICRLVCIYLRREADVKSGQGSAGLTDHDTVIVLIVSSLSSSRRRRRIIGACFLENATAADHEKDHEFEV